MTQRGADLFIRADADTVIGTGHVMRTLALAQAWGHRDQVTFVCSSLPNWLSNRISVEGFSIYEIPAPHPSPADLSDTLDCLSGAADPWVVVDGYCFDLDYQQALAKVSRVLLMDDGVFTDEHVADLLVNQNMGAEILSYTKCDQTGYLLGADYALLRDEFLCLPKPSVPSSRSDAFQILATLGGSDPGNHSLKVIRALSLLDDHNVQAKLVVGGSNPDWSSLSDAARDVKSVRLVRDAVMPREMSEADLAITAGGSTCWELAYMGVPSMVLVVAENQVGIAGALQRSGAALSLGWADDVSAEGIAESVRDLLATPRKREGMAMAGQASIDGSGRCRVVEAMASI